MNLCLPSLFFSFNIFSSVFIHFPYFVYDKRHLKAFSDVVIAWRLCVCAFNFFLGHIWYWDQHFFFFVRSNVHVVINVSSRKQCNFTLLCLSFADDVCLWCTTLTFRIKILNRAWCKTLDGNIYCRNLMNFIYLKDLLSLCCHCLCRMLRIIAKILITFHFFQSHLLPLHCVCVVFIGIALPDFP